jgi:hypothetical protein
MADEVIDVEADPVDTKVGLSDSENAELTGMEIGINRAKLALADLDMLAANLEQQIDTARQDMLQKLGDARKAVGTASEAYVNATRAALAAHGFEGDEANGNWTFDAQSGTLVRKA